MFKHTSDILKDQGINRSTLVIFEGRARANIKRLGNRAAGCCVTMRPHFKTHQSETVAGWFADEGIDRITVSSLDMAVRFATAGWRDITIAFLLNPLERPRLLDLASRLAARKGRLGCTIDSTAAAEALRTTGTVPPVDVWLKIDTGYGRTGIPWDDRPLLRAVVGALTVPPRGLLTHAGHGYRARSRKALRKIWDETVARMQAARTILERNDLMLSVGDTPTCSVVEDYSGVDEIRPGNFVFYDLMQLQIGSCGPDDLAAAVACPVVGIYPDRRQVVIHGGAVHLSKESLQETGGRIFGRPGLLDPPRILDGARVTGLSQEHGVITFADGAFPAAHELSIGDLMLVWPVHSCLATDLLTVRPAPSVAFIP